MRLITFVPILTCWSFMAWANVEKRIFSAPESVLIPQGQPNLDRLRLDTLTPYNSTLRRQLKAAFPTSTDPEGPATWYLLDSLVDQRRYELRLCWLATQPTDFTINVFELNEVFSNPALISSLALFSEELQALPPFVSNKRQPNTSLLFLKVNAKAAYFTPNTTLMTDVPVVAVDLILDPYILNVLPASLAPIGLHLILIAIVSWPLSKAIYHFLHHTSQTPNHPNSLTSLKEE
ncbi:hypothetical protein XANCAGTX0491_005834 [Xanthoria calcicola]